MLFARSVTLDCRQDCHRRAEHRRGQERHRTGKAKVDQLKYATLKKHLQGEVQKL